ncbi:DUF930 domain-containing protein [Endobacterium cereale]|nr:DUF930 domain-containing protein [Endobacterium cereale]
MWTWGIPASFLIHAIIAFIILIGIPFDLPKPEAEETVSVEIVPPPEQAKSEQANPEKAAGQEEQKEALPPPVEKSPQQAEQQPPPPPTEKQQEQAQQPPPAEAPAEPERSSPATPLEDFRPVFQIGEKDAGPKRAENGESDRDEAATKRAETDSENSAHGSGKQPGSASRDAAAQEKPQSDDGNGPSGASVPEIAVPEVGLGAPVADAAGTPMPAAGNPAVNTEIAAATATAEKKADEQAIQPADGARAAKPAGLTQAKRLYSSHAADNPFVIEAMKQMSRGDRAGALCNTELGEQLVRGSPAYHPARLPKPTLESGNVIDVQTAFSADGRWYDVSLRCEVDKGAMKVVSFAYKVGKAIPKSEWRKRGFPSY